MQARIKTFFINVLHPPQFAAAIKSCSADEPAQARTRKNITLAATEFTVARPDVKLLCTRASYAADDPSRLVCALCCNYGQACLRPAPRPRGAWLRFQPRPGRVAIWIWLPLHALRL